MMELEKMQRLMELAISEKERCVVHKGISTLATAYKTLIWGTGEAIKREGQLSVPLGEARDALKEMSRLGKKYGIAFPEANDPKELVEYIARWGQEIVCSQE